MVTILSFGSLTYLSMKCKKGKQVNSFFVNNLFQIVKIFKTDNYGLTGFCMNNIVIRRYLVICFIREANGKVDFLQL